MKPHITLTTVVPLVLLCASMLGCSMIDRDNDYTPAPLKPRAEGLYASEFEGQSKKYNDAVSKLAESPDEPAQYGALAQVYMYEARVTGDHPYYYPAALAAIHEALEIDADDVQALTLKTSVLLSLHRFEEALVLAQRLTSEVAGSHTLFGMLCDANVELGNYAAAVRAADRMVALRPGLESYARISYLRELHGDMEGSIDAMRMAVKAGLPGTEDAAWTRTTFGNLLLKYGRIDEAEEQFQIARFERHDYPFALAGIAAVRTKQKRHDEALELLDAALSMIPEISFVELQVDVHQLRGDTVALKSSRALIAQMQNEDRLAGMIAD